MSDWLVSMTVISVSKSLTLKLVFAHVDKRRRIDDIGREIVDHFDICNRKEKK
jgi:hypothetical protein